MGVEKDELQRLIEQGLTIREIAKRVGRGSTTVRYWLARHGLRTVGAEQRELAGGRGYDAYVGALQFHHMDPDSKTFGLSQGGFTRSLEAVRAETRKCVLLCSNCHAEVEGGFRALPSGLLTEAGAADNL